MEAPGTDDWRAPEPPRPPSEALAARAEGPFEGGPPAPPCVSENPTGPTPVYQPSEPVPGGRTDDAATEGPQPRSWTIGAFILAAVIGLFVVFAFGFVIVSLRGCTDPKSQEKANAESPAAVRQDLRSAYGSQLSTLSVTLTPAADGGAGTMHVRYRLKGTSVDVKGKFNAFSGLADSGLAPPLAREQDRLSVDEIQRLIRAWSRRSRLSISSMVAYASVEEEDFVTFSGRKYAVADLWYVKSSGGGLSWVIYRDPKHGTFAPVQKDPDIVTPVD